jgi:hypothetical protein
VIGECHAVSLADPVLQKIGSHCFAFPDTTLEVRERIDSIQPSLHKLGILLSQRLVIADPTLFVLAIDLHLIEPRQRLQRSEAYRAIFYDLCAHIIQYLLEQLRCVRTGIHQEITDYVRQIL